MPTLAQRAKTPRRIAEKSFEDSFADALRACGLESWHLTARDPGWPDRYVQTGIWIEFKVLIALTNDQLEPEQKGRLRALASAGEPVWYCAWHEGKILLTRFPFTTQIAELTRHPYRTRADLERLIEEYIK